MKSTQKSILPEKEMLLRLSNARRRIRDLQQISERTLTPDDTITATNSQFQASVSALAQTAASLRVQQITSTQSIFRRIIEARRRRSISRHVVSRLRWLEELIVKSAGDGPSSDAARLRLKELDGDTRFAQVLQRQANVVGLGDEVRSTLARVFEAIDQAYPRQARQDSMIRAIARVEEESANEHRAASIGI